MKEKTYHWIYLS